MKPEIITLHLTQTGAHIFNNNKTDFIASVFLATSQGCTRHTMLANTNTSHNQRLAGSTGMLWITQ